MRVQRLDIENFRGIREMRIDFHPRLNVFAGKNGAGKTTIFNALGRAIQTAHLNHVTGNERQDLESRVTIIPHDIRIGAEQSRISLQFSLRGKPVCTTVSSNPKETASDLSSHFPGAGIRIPYHAFLEDRSTLTGTYMPDEKTRNLISGADPLTGRAVLNITRFGWAFEWISDREAEENSELRKFIDSGKEFGRDPFERNKPLQAVKNAIAEITGFAGLFDDRKKRGFTVRKRPGAGEEVLLFSQLSSGEQHLVAFVATIAAFLADSFPEAENPLNSEAVLMVDAVELHLHPSWQREIIPGLLAAFPNCQFVITTHSPQILSHIREPESIFLLKLTDEGIQARHPESVYGLDSNRILEDVMEVPARPGEIKVLIEKLFDTIDRKDLEKARNQLDSLKQNIGTDPQLTKAEVLIRRTEIIGR